MRADHIASGRAFQRIWLTAEQLGLRLQPEYTPVEFARHVHHGLTLTKVASLQRRIERLVSDYAALLAPIPPERCLMLVRLGEGPPAQARALRLSLAELTLSQPAP
jgi:hypothetical protein